MTSARGCLDEPKIYGVVRLLEALARVTEIQKTTAQIQPDPFLDGMRPRIEKAKVLSMGDTRELQKQLDLMIQDFTAELEKRHLQGT